MDALFNDKQQAVQKRSILIEFEFEGKYVVFSYVHQFVTAFQRFERHDFGKDKREGAIHKLVLYIILLTV